MLFLKCFIKIDKKFDDIKKFKDKFYEKFKEKNLIDIQNKFQILINYKQDGSSFVNYIFEFEINLDENLKKELNPEKLKLISKNILISIEEIDSVKRIYRFYDYSIIKELESFYPKLFEIEMRVREFFSFILIELEDEFKDEFLKDSNIKPKEVSNEKYLRNNFENDLFYLTYGQYEMMNNFNKPYTSLNPIIQKIYNLEKDFSFQNLISLLNSLNSKMHLKQHREKIININSNLTEINKVRKKIAHMRVLDYSDINLNSEEFNFNEYIQNINEEIDALYSLYQVKFKPIITYAYIYLEHDRAANLPRQNHSTIVFEDGTEEEIDFGDENIFQEKKEKIEQEAKEMLRNYLKDDYDIDGLEDELIEVEEI